MKTILSEQGYLVKKQDLTEDQITTLKDELTVSPEVLDSFKDYDKSEPFKIYGESPNYYFLPRHYGLETFGAPTKNKIDGGESVNFPFVFDLLPHQHNAYKAAKKAFRSQSCGGVLSLPCGYGKTSLSIKLASELCCIVDPKYDKERPSARTIVIVNQEDIMDQWEESIDKFTGGKARIGRIQRNVVDIEDKDFVIAMLHSVSGKDYPDEIFRGFKLLIVDEVHHLGASFFSRALKKINCMYNLGLSATPNRRDGLSKVFYYFLGNLFHHEKRDGKNRVLVKRIHIKSNSSYYKTIYMSNGKTRNTAAMINQLAVCPFRNRLIVEVNRVLAMDSRRQTLMLSARKDSHLYPLRELIEKERLKNDKGQLVTAGFYHGRSGITRKKHKQILEVSRKCDLILGTQHVAREALDIPSLNTEGLLTPMADVEQAVGRILRRFYDNLWPLVYEFVDYCGSFPGQAEQRRQFYMSQNYEVQNFRMELNEESDLDKYLDTLSVFLLQGFRNEKIGECLLDDSDDQEEVARGPIDCLLDD